MNFLAHLYLSGTSEGLIIGNFIGDSVKGRDLNRYAKKVQEGIILHRKIDFFTDHHPIAERSKKRIRKEFRKYAPVIIDVFYDHFLATNWDIYSKEALNNYVKNTYQLLEQNSASFPERAQYMLPFMITQNWIENYKTIEGIKKALTGLASRTRFKSNMELAHNSLEKEYKELDKDFKLFFPELIDYVESLGYPIRKAHWD